MSTTTARAAFVDREVVRLETELLEDLDRLQAYRLIGNRDRKLPGSLNEQFHVSTNWVKTNLRSRGDLKRRQADWKADIEKDQMLLLDNLYGIPKAKDRSTDVCLRAPKDIEPGYERRKLNANRLLLLKNIDDILGRLRKNLYQQPYQQTLIKLHKIIREARDLKQYLTANAAIETGKDFFHDMESKPFSVFDDVYLYDTITNVLGPLMNMTYQKLILSASADSYLIVDVDDETDGESGGDTDDDDESALFVTT